jgi:hypothetical protein
MILLIVFLLSAHVIGTNRDVSVSRMFDEGFHVRDEVLARDSQGFDRVVSQFRGPRAPGVDVVPSWLLGGAGGTTQVIHLGVPTNRRADGYDYEIQEMPGWTISYYEVDARHINIYMYHLAANELLRRCRHIQAHNVVYFSRPNPGTTKSWVYTIIDDGPPIPKVLWIMSRAPSLRERCRVIETVTDLSLLRIRHPHIMIDPFQCLIHSLSRINLLDTGIMPSCSYCVHNHPARTLRDTLARIGQLIHSDSRGTFNLRFGFYTDEFIRRAFFLDSETPAPLSNAEGLVYQFRSLEEVIGSEFPEYARDEIPSKFAQFVDLFTHAWRMTESDPISIPPRVESIVDLIDQIPPFVLK